MKNQLISTQKAVERVYLVGVQTGEVRRAEAEASFEELRRLAASTTCEIVGGELCRVRVPAPSTYLTDGIVESLTAALLAAEVDTAILDEDITATQQRNLETRWNVKVVTRSELILDIFAHRARTSEGKLQVELAQLQYRLPRLRGMGVEMSRLGGGIGTRGPGEMKLETDRRAIEQRIHALEQKILKLKQQRGTQRARRQSSSLPTIALVGYTNAGKSTLLNALTGAEAFVEDKLFATLDTTTRRGKLPSGMAVAFTDTVGFINRLPTQLAAAFRATLEEVQYADFLIHVVDATSDHYEEEIKVTEGVLKDLGAGAVPTLTAWNKTDALGKGDDPRFYERRRKPSVAVSARERTGLDRLLLELEKLVNAANPLVWLKFDYASYGEVAKLEASASVQQILHSEEAIYVCVALPQNRLAKYAERITESPAEPR